jgi:hypothetical protein
MKKHEVHIELDLIRPVSSVHDWKNWSAGYRWWFESQWKMGHKLYAVTRKEAIRLLRQDTEEAILKQEEREDDELACEKAAHGVNIKGGSDE